MRFLKCVMRLGLSAAMIAGPTAAAGCTNGEVFDGTTVGVLETRGRVHLVDLESGEVRRTHRLRSHAYDIDADPDTGFFVTAQSGGVGGEADDRMGVIDARGSRGVRYVRLPEPNPGGVAVVGDGRVVLDHGIQDKEGMFVCLADTKSMSVVRSGHVPDNNTPMRVVDGVGWASCVDMDGRASLRRVNTETLESEEVLGGADFPIIWDSGPEGLYGWLIEEPGKARIARFDAKTGAVEASASVTLEDGPGAMVTSRGRIVAADFTGEDLDRHGSRLLVIDPATLEVEREIRVPGGPCDLKAWRDRVVVAVYRDKTLRIVDPATGSIERTIRLPEMSPLPFNIAVMD